MRAVNGLAILMTTALVLSACVEPQPIAFDGQDKPRFLRVTLRPNGPNVYSSNYLAFPASMPAGRPAQIKMFSPQRVDLNLNSISYQMYPVTVPFDRDPQVFLKKYFVDKPGELALEKLPEARRKNIENGTWELGMSKEQVYTTLGPPQWIDFGVDATNLPLEVILGRNRWEYRESDIMFTFWPIKRALLFDDGKLRQSIPP